MNHSVYDNYYKVSKTERRIIMKTILKATLKRILTLTLVLAFFVAAFPPLSVSAATISFPSLSDSAFCEFTATKTIPVYRDSAFNTRGTSSPAKSYAAEIWSGDVCRIISLTSNYIKLQYPTSSGMKTGFIKRSALIGVSAPSEKVTSAGKATTYLNTSGKAYGYTEKGDTVYKLGASGNYTAIMYTAKSGSRAWKYGFVLTSEYESKIKAKAPVSVTESSWQYPMNDAYCTWRSSNGMSWGNYNNTGSGRNYHVGIDIAGSSSKVYAAASGTVAAVGYNSANGNFVVIKHTLSGSTVYSFYAHLKSYSVSKNDVVKKGAQIGVVGSTGSSVSGTHLHFSIMNTLNTNGGYVGYVTQFSGDKVTYSGTTFYNPVYIIKNNKLP